MIIESILPIPDIFSARRVLCIQPHYDDNDIGAGGTIARLSQVGAEIYYLTVTDDLMGVVDTSLSPEAVAKMLQRDQEAAGQIMGVKEQIALGYPDGGKYDYFDLRSNLLKYMRSIQPDFVFAPDPWLAYEAHHDHIQTGLAAAEAVLLAGVTKIASSDPAIDAAYQEHDIQGIAFYYTREPNEIIDITLTWETKLAAVRCYKAQFTPSGMAELVMALDNKLRQVADGKPYEHGEPLKLLNPRALHCGL
jgi:LmbE family N-acetylglucosaminyl deacetylase